MTPGAKGSRHAIHAGLPRKFRHQVRRNQIAKLPENSEFGCGWFGVSFHHLCRVTKLKSHANHFSFRPLWRFLWDGCDITYQGSRTAHLPISRATYAPVAGELENEEAAAYVGLRNFLRGLAVDRQEVKVQKGRVSPPFLSGVTFRSARSRCALIQEPVT